MSEEAEEDLANNNDPNNNAGDLGAPPMENANLIVLPPPTTSASTTSAAAAPELYEATSSSYRQNDEVDLVSPSSAGPLEPRHDVHMAEANEYVLEQMRELDKTAEDRREELRKELEDNTRLILKVFPKKSFHEVYSYLEAYYDKPNRVEIVLNEFIEQGGADEVENKQQPPEDEDEPEQRKPKGKTGNGMKSKNSKKNSAEQPDMGEEEERWRRRDGYDDDGKRVSKRKSDVAEEMDQSPKKAKGGKIKGKGKGKGKSSAERNRKEADLSENLIYGPFDFSAHRQEKGTKSIREAFQDASPSLQDQERGEGEPASIKSPEVVDLFNDETPAKEPPPIVDISSADRAEKRELFNSFKNMFPATPVAYLEEQAEELAGKPAATERFIGELLSRGCQPPDYWTPTEKVVTVIGDEGTTPMEWDPLVTDDEKKPADPSEAGADMAKTAAETAAAAGRLEDINAEIALLEQEYTAKIQNHGAEDVPEEAAEGAGAAAAAQQAPPQPETEEDKIDLKFSTLQALFPQADPEFLHQKVQELIGDEGQYNRWVDESFENKGKDFPSRVAYEKRLREAKLMEQYSQEVTAEEILEMYDDPVAYFSDMTRKVSDLYKRHAIGHLKKVFRNVSANAINKAFSESNSLYYPSYKKLMTLVGTGGRKNGNARKTKRPDHECSVPVEIDINFLKVILFIFK